MDFSQKLRLIRISKNLSQQEMATELGLKSQQVYSNLENGSTKKISQDIIVYINKNYSSDMNNRLNEDEETYQKKDKTLVNNPTEFLTHEMIEVKAMMRIVLRSQAEILAEKRSESVTKILGELSKAVSDEISVSVSELKQGK